jgi:hypothetical protein
MSDWLKLNTEKNVRCKICNESFEDHKTLHRHLRSHDCLIVDYYHAYYPRKDLYTGDLIKFKNREQYLSQDFNNRNTMKNWFMKTPREEVKAYCHTYLKRRVRQKNLKFTPSEVEVRSLMCPPVPHLNMAFDGYYDYCSTNFNLKNKYTIWPENAEQRQLPPMDMKIDSFQQSLFKIYVDSREQKPFKLNLPTEVKALKYGDYALSEPRHSGNIYIERKSITDFIGTLSGGYNRFVKEIERAEKDKVRLVVLVEESINDCLSFKHLPYVSKKIKATPEFIFHNVRALLQEYERLDFLFVRGRSEATRVAEKLLLHGNLYTKIDLQLAYDLKKL